MLVRGVDCVLRAEPPYAAFSAFASVVLVSYKATRVMSHVRERAGEVDNGWKHDWHQAIGRVRKAV